MFNGIEKNTPDSNIIIGAGPAGLTAGYELSKLGQKSTILEADKLVGGISRTVNYNGYRFDIGGHRFFSKVPYVNELWNEILDGQFLERSRLSRIHYHNHFFDYPLKISNALVGLGPVESFLVGLSYAKSKFSPTDEEKTFEQWISNRFGTRLFNIFFKNYTEKVWGIPCNEISADWAAQRIKNLSLSEAIRNAFVSNGTTKSGEKITSLIDKFHYPNLGPGMMWEACEGILNDFGSPTLKQQFVNRIFHKNGRVSHILTKNTRNEATEYSGSNFISTMPLKELIFSLDPAPPDEILKAAKLLRYRDYLTVVLMIDRPHVFPDNWIYIHTPEVKMGRIQNYKNWSPDMVPDSSKTSLGLEYFLWEKDEEWTWEDSRLIELGINECAALNLIQKNEVLEGTVVRMKKAYPVYDSNYHHCVELLRQYMGTFENLQTIGRNGLHRYNNQDHSMLTGVYAARNTEQLEYDVWAVNTEQEYHETDKATAKTGDRLVPTKIPEETPADGFNLEKKLKEQLKLIDSFAMGSAVGLVSGFLLFFATILLIIKSGQQNNPTLALLSNFLPGYKDTLPGALIGLFEVGIGSFSIAYLISSLMNWTFTLYLSIIKRNSEIEENKTILDKV